MKKTNGIRVNQELLFEDSFLFNFVENISIIDFVIEATSFNFFFTFPIIFFYNQQTTPFNSL